MTAPRTLLVGDVGATHTRVAVVGTDGRLQHRESGSTTDSGLAALLRDFLRRHGAAPRSAVLGVAGRVHGAARATLTNRALRIDADALSAELGIPFEVHNDIVALAAALPALGADDLDMLGGPPPSAAHPRLVVAVGSGLGAALATALGECVATEAGHIALPAGAARHLGEHAAAFGSVESLLSGDGLRRLVTAHGGRLEAPDRIDPSDPPTAAAAERFAAALGDVCATLALATGAWGGVHLAGGVVGALGPLLRGATLRAALRRGGPFGEDIARLPVVRLVDADAALRGLARLGARHG